MAWWAALYALSMLARYQLAEWATYINIDGSRHAVALETLLKQEKNTPTRVSSSTHLRMLHHRGSL
jgi:hypothetical protein